MLCFWEGDQHDKERKSSVFVTKISRTEDEVTLQAVSDLKLRRLDNSKKNEMPVRPTSATKAKSLFSENRD